MKKIVLCFAGLLTLLAASSQTFDTSIAKLAGDIVEKVHTQNRTKLAVADFLNSEGKTDRLTAYIRTELETKLVNNNMLQVMDRKHLKKLLEENHLQSQGLIDESLVRSVTGFIKIEGLIQGQVSYVGQQVKIKITGTDVNTSLIFCASSVEFRSDVLVKNILNPPKTPCTDCGGRGMVQRLSACTACSGKGYSVCNDCKGTGKRTGMTVGSYIPCENCNAKGKWSCILCSGSGKVVGYQTCPKCNHEIQQRRTLQKGIIETASYLTEYCPDCEGTGKRTKESICNHCNGLGEEPFGVRSSWQKRICRTCSGKKVTIAEITCHTCSGTGKQ